VSCCRYSRRQKYPEPRFRGTNGRLPPPTADVSSPATTYTYNLDWKPTSETRPDGVTITKTYDSAGRLSQQVTPTGTKTSSYYPAGSTGTGVAPGKLAGIEGPMNVDLAYSYDGSLLTATTWSGDVEGVVSFGYDNNFWKVSEVVSGASGSQAATFGYDADGLVVCVSPTTCPGSGALNFERHLGNGMVTSATSGLLAETQSVNAYGEPARHVVTDGTTTLYDLTLDSTLFPRDPLGRIVRKTEVVLGTTRASDYTYDVLGRLTDVVVNDTATEHYEYDPNGNRLRGVVTRDGVTTDWTGTYDAQDRLLSYGPLSFTYTANGELLTKTNADTAEVTGYTYDAFGNLRGVELPDGRLVEYLVDGQNRRVAKNIDGLTTKQWLWSSQLRIAGELDASGALTKRFLYGEKVNVPELMVDVVSGAVYRIVTDQLGSPVLVVNVADTTDVLLRAEYDAFGNRTVLSGDGDAVPFGFAGGLYDEDTGLVRFGARDYEPVMGRWVTKDPIRFGAVGTNAFQYALGNPVTEQDVTGRDVFRCRRPLGGPDVPDLSNRKSGPDIRINPFHHDYLCVFQGGHWICGGQGASGSVFGSPGAPYNEDTFTPKRCDTISEEDLCLDSCIASQLESHRRPYYDIRGGGFGTNCQEWVDIVVGQCQMSCADL